MPPNKTSKIVNSQNPIYLFKIELAKIEPKIWRKFYAPSNITLKDFNHVILTVMGWLGRHLHDFDIYGQWYDDGPYDDGYSENEAKYKLNSFNFRKNSKFKYTYDFGDEWIHIIQVLDTDYIPEKKGRKYGCIDGARSCPPEDIGGPDAYNEFLEAIKDPNHEAHEEMLTRLGDFFEPEDFDPEYFFLKEIDKDLVNIKKVFFL